MYVFEGEQGYLDLMRLVIEEGVDTPDRTGVGCRKVFGAVLTFDLSEGFPGVTHRSAPPRFGMEEFWFFLRGGTQTKELEAKGIEFWAPQTSRDWLDGRGLTHLPAGHYGKAYGFQLRHFGGSLQAYGQRHPEGGIDQVGNLANTLLKDPYSRRMVVSMWNPAQEKEMALPPCWYSHNFNVIPTEDGGQELNLLVNARSADLLYGTPFNWQQYAIYLMAMAKLNGMRPGRLECVLADAHIYHNQIEYAQEALAHKVSAPCRLEFKKPFSTLDQMLALTWDDIDLVGHEVDKTPFKAEKPPMAA